MKKHYKTPTIQFECLDLAEPILAPSTSNTMVGLVNNGWEYDDVGDM